MSEAAIGKRTRITCTLGPSCWSVEMLGVLLDEGMTIARFNFSHGDHATHSATLKRLREAVAARPGRFCGVMLDTKGPEIRTGFFAAPNDGGKIKLEAGQKLTLTTDYEYKSDGTKLALTYDKLPTSVKPGNEILVADGTLVLVVVSCHPERGEVVTEVKNSCSIGERKNCNLPGVNVELPVLQQKDIDDIVKWGIPEDVDFVAASFVQSADDVALIRKTLGVAGGHIKIISKIENQEGLKNLQAITEATDAIMVARGDLGMEIPPEQVFVEQKRMTTLCNQIGKPCIVATQMLESMITNPRPTRAECSDVANAVLDGADCVMLSGETAGGANPQAAVSIMARTCLRAEQTMDLKLDRSKILAAQPTPVDPSEGLMEAAVTLADSTGAKAIIVLAVTGESARLVAKYRPNTPVVVVTNSARTARYAAGLLSGVHVLLEDIKFGGAPRPSADPRSKYSERHPTAADEACMAKAGTAFAQRSLGASPKGGETVVVVHCYRNLEGVAEGVGCRVTTTTAL